MINPKTLPSATGYLVRCSVFHYAVIDDVFYSLQHKAVKEMGQYQTLHALAQQEYISF